MWRLVGAGCGRLRLAGAGWDWLKLAGAGRGWLRDWLRLCGAGTGGGKVLFPATAPKICQSVIVLKSDVIDFLAEIGGEPGSESYQIEELRVEPGSRVCGKSLRELDLSHVLGVIIMGLRRGERPMTYNPSAETTLEGNDIVIALAPTSRLEELAEMVAAGR